jgi:hypothetical protein
LKTILQIVPKTPGSFDGVGDYALTVARKLRQLFGYETIFASRDWARSASAAGFEVRPLEDRGTNRLSAAEFDHVILHYVNYGYQARGIPFALVRMVRELRQNCRGGFLTIFHELYASGPPWTSPFWLQPLQKRIAGTIAQLSSACLVSSEGSLRQLRRIASDAKGIVHPVPSNFGEPDISPDQIRQRDAHRWTICGGTALIERSLKSFREVRQRIPAEIAPRQLSVFGGNDSSSVRSLLLELGIGADYRPGIASAEASSILSASSFLWLDYFDRPDVPLEFVLKSTAFAAASAHGVIPIFPHRSSEISVGGDRLPGPFFVEPDSLELPAPDDRAKVAERYYGWYQRHASSDHLARGIGRALELTA